MGLLDDAIREHLELKRRRGADPTEVERAEREILAPVEHAEAADDDHHGHAPHDQALGERGADFSSVGQETAEFDMTALLSDGAGAGEVDSNAAHAPADAHDRPQPREWEPLDIDDRAGPAEEIPGQERLTFE